MSWQMASDRPIYRQIVERLERSIVAGAYAPGEKLPSVRDLAEEAAVNPNTMQRALTELEQSGLVYVQRTSGRYVTEDPQCIAQMRRALAEARIDAFLSDMATLGYDARQTAALLEERKAET